MTLQLVRHEIESHAFAACLGVANTAEMLYTAMASQAAVRELVGLCTNRDNAYRLLSAAVSLVKEQDDVGYRNPRDAALGTYLWVLAQTQPDLAQVLAASALNAPRLWWARKVALDLVRRHAPAPESATRISDENERKISIPVQRDLLIISEPAECAVIAGKFVEIHDAKTNSTETRTDTPYSINNPSGQEIVVSR
jgi:hypothetical protein